MDIRTILVPVDFSDHSAKALQQAVELAKSFGAVIHLLHCYPVNVGGITPYGPEFPGDFDRQFRDAAKRKLSECSEKVAGEGVAVEQTLTPMLPSEAISSAAQERGADLIVMGTRGLTGLKHVMLGSVAERTIRIAPCPVLTVKAEQPE